MSVHPTKDHGPRRRSRRAHPPCADKAKPMQTEVARSALLDYVLGKLGVAGVSEAVN